MSGHTPGPWKLGCGYGWFGVEIVGNDGCRRVCGVAHVRQDVRDPDGRVTGQEDEPEGKANARLIASAPRLLSALETMYAMFNGNGVTPEDDAAIDAARAAIAEATGAAP